MAKSPQYDAVLLLGKQLVKELNLDESVDTLSKWMAHYIAELISRVEVADNQNRLAELSRCSTAILDLWSNHNLLPNGSRPFQDFEPIFRALESLDPDNTMPRYFQTIRRNIEVEEQDSEASKWLGIADSLDSTARNLIIFCLASAANSAIDKSKKWVSLVEATELENENYLPVIQFISKEADIVHGTSITDERRDELKKRIDSLEAFSKIAQILTMELQVQLKKIT